MKTFLVENEKQISYDALLTDINNASTCFPQFKTSNLYDFFLNLIVSLLAHKPLLLIDSDISDMEIEGINAKLLNTPIEIQSFQIAEIKDIINKIQQSKSKISIFTSGTTGQPKKVVHTVQALIRTVRISDNNSNQIWGFAYNPTHMAGLQVFFQAFLNTNTLVNLFNCSRSQIYKLIDKHLITNISATPTFYRLLLPLENSYSHIQRVTFGGEKSDNKLHEDVLRIFPNAKINNIYASTEAGSLFSTRGESFLIPENITDKIKVVDGELLIHKSLLGQSDSFTFIEDYYCTGDLIEWVDEKRFVFKFISRKNELINTGGYKVNPSEVESNIMQIPEVIQVIVFGKPNSILGNILCAEVKVETISQLTELDIRRILSEKLQDFKIPRRIKFVDSFSLTRTGKLKRI
jgi:acyl-coenzyme A synthetase/AMP-(fatty) acid ligase